MTVTRPLGVRTRRRIGESTGEAGRFPRRLGSRLGSWQSRRYIAGVQSTDTTSQINTRAVSGRRKLRFASLDEMLVEANRLADGERDASLTTLGNWSVGQAFGHLAGWIGYAFDGYPMRPPLIMKIVGRLIKKKVLRDGMPAGMRLPKATGGTYAGDPMPLDEGLRRLTQAVGRLRAAGPVAANPVFGTLTHQQWIELNLRHAELHVSFFCPRGSEGPGTPGRR